MKQLTFISLLLFIFTGCSIPTDNNCPDITLDLSKKTKDWLAPQNALSGDSLTFYSTLGDSQIVRVSAQPFTAQKTPVKDCPITLKQGFINYWGNYDPNNGRYTTFSIIAIAQNISFLATNSFCYVDDLNTFNTQDETIQNRNGLLNYQKINDFDFKGEKIMVLTGTFGLSTDFCINNDITHIRTFWLSPKYGLVKFQDKQNEIWTRKL